METVRFNYRAYPRKREAKLARRTLGCCRVAFNDAIRECRNAHTRGEKHPSLTMLQRVVVAEGKQHPDREWLAECSAVALQQAVADAHTAYRNFFASVRGDRPGRRVGQPRFKSHRDRRRSARFTRNARFKIRDGRQPGRAEVFLPLIGWVPFVLSRALPSQPSSVTLILDADDTFHVSFVVRRPTREHRPTGRAAGVDVGLTAFASVVSIDLATGSETTLKINTPRFLRRRQRALARSQRSLTRKAKGGRNRDRQRARLVRMHRRVADARLDHAHQTAARLAASHDLVVTEDYAAHSTIRNRRLARSASDQALGQFLRVLRDKPCEHVVVDRFYPSTQLCSNCGQQTGPRGVQQLSVRYWTCPDCGVSHDRDINAARNLLREGLRSHAVADGRSDTQNACEPASKTRPVRARREPRPQRKRAGSTVGEPAALT